MNRDELIPIIEMMEKYGGEFSKSLADCMLKADPDNLRKLVETFPEIIEKYKNFKTL